MSGAPRNLAAALAAALALSGCVAPGLEETGVRAAIDHAWRWHIESAVREDLDQVMQIYTEDVVYVIPGVQEVYGEAAVRQMEARTLEGNDLIFATHTTRALHVVGDAAYELGTVSGPIRPRGQEAAVVTWHFLAFWRRGPDEVWRIQYLVGEAES